MNYSFSTNKQLSFTENFFLLNRALLGAIYSPVHGSFSGNWGCYYCSGKPFLKFLLASTSKLFFFGSLFLYQIFRKQLQPIEFIKILIQQRAEGIGIRQLHHYAGYNPHKIFRDWHATGRGFMGFYVGYPFFTFLILVLSESSPL